MLGIIRLIKTMNQKISAPVSVNASYDHATGKVAPRWVLWNGRPHKVREVGLHHTFREGRTLFHVFSVVSDTLFFRLVLDTETLSWKLTEISDGLAG